MSDQPYWTDPKFIYDEGGYDRSVIRDALSMTPAERLEMLEEMLAFAEQVWRLNGITPVSYDDPNPGEP